MIETTSLILGQKLAQAGVWCDSYFHQFENGPVIHRAETPYDEESDPDFKEAKYYHAYTACELLDILSMEFCIFKDDDGWNCELQGDIEKIMTADTVADTLAMMLLWLLENNHITTEEIH